MVLIWLPPERSVYHRTPRPVRFPLPLPSRTLDRPAAARIEAVHWRRAVSFDSPVARCTARPVARATSCRPRASRTIVRSRFASARRASAGVRRHSGGRLPGRRPDPWRRKKTQDGRRLRRCERRWPAVRQARRVRCTIGKYAIFIAANGLEQRRIPGTAPVNCRRRHSAPLPPLLRDEAGSRVDGPAAAMTCRRPWPAVAEGRSQRDRGGGRTTIR